VVCSHGHPPPTSRWLFPVSYQVREQWDTRDSVTPIALRILYRCLLLWGVVVDCTQLLTQIVIHVKHIYPANRGPSGLFARANNSVAESWIQLPPCAYIYIVRAPWYRQGHRHRQLLHLLPRIERILVYQQQVQKSSGAN
jgi:hypothetical protein